MLHRFHNRFSQSRRRPLLGNYANQTTPPVPYDGVGDPISHLLTVGSSRGLLRDCKTLPINRVQHYPGHSARSHNIAGDLDHTLNEKYKCSRCVARRHETDTSWNVECHEFKWPHGRVSSLHSATKPLFSSCDFPAWSRGPGRPRQCVLIELLWLGTHQTHCKHHTSGGI